MAGIGAEKRTTILPTADPGGPGFLGPSYDPSNFIPLPGDIGVHRGGDLSDVTNAIKGVAYYSDVIGFGESSNNLTQGMDFQHYGVNYFMRTGAKCSNGADMWVYVDTIPKGNALGSRVKAGLQSAGLPQMRGLAPGMLEDVESALNPEPVINALFSGAYPSCRQVTLPVGDERGVVADPDTGELWVEGPVAAGSTQTRWVQDKALSREEWLAAPKTMNADGTPVNPKKAEGFREATHPYNGIELATTIVLGFIATLWFRYR